jgi:protein-arginine kinase activator protein McsA
MWGEAYATLAEKIFSWVTDEDGLAAFRKRRAIATLQKEIRDAIKQNDFNTAAARLGELRRLSDAP